MLPIHPLDSDAELDPVADAEWNVKIFSSTSLFSDIITPINPESVARGHKIPIFQYPLDPDCTGYLDWDDKGAFIVINSNNNISNYGFSPQQRYTIACCLGYFYYIQRLNFPQVQQNCYASNFYHTDSESKYITSFATTLLMPEKAVRAKLDMLTNLDTHMRDTFGIADDITALAHIFNVSEKDMAKRLYDLGINA